MLPTFNILNLVKKHKRRMRIDGLIGLQNHVEIIGFHTYQSLVIEVNIDYLLQMMSVLQQLFGTFV